MKSSFGSAIFGRDILTAFRYKNDHFRWAPDREPLGGLPTTSTVSCHLSLPLHHRFCPYPSWASEFRAFSPGQRHQVVGDHSQSYPTFLPWPATITTTREPVFGARRPALRTPCRSASPAGIGVALMCPSGRRTRLPPNGRIPPTQVASRVPPTVP